MAGKNLPIAINPPPGWHDLTIPLNLEKIEREVEEFYVPPLRSLVKALCQEIQDLRKKVEDLTPNNSDSKS